MDLLQEEDALVIRAVQGILMRPTLQSVSRNNNVLLNWDEIQISIFHSSVLVEANFFLIKFQEIKPQM